MRPPMRGIEPCSFDVLILTRGEARSAASRLGAGAAVPPEAAGAPGRAGAPTVGAAGARAPPRPLVPRAGGVSLGAGCCALWVSGRSTKKLEPRRDASHNTVA